MILSKNLNKKSGFLFAALLLASTCFVTSCQKESSVSPEPVPSYSNVPSADSLSSFSSSATSYKIVGPINLYNKSNMTISGDSIAGGNVACIQLINCKNIRITHCKLGRSKSFGILIGNSSNIQVDSCNISNVATGILAITCPAGAIRITHNQILNTQGPFPQGGGVQFSNVSGHNNHIDYNRIQNVAGQSNPEDKVSVYKSNGVAGDPITVTGNLILGSGASTSSCGITLGDQGGSYQVAQNNTIVNSGAGGAQIAGGTFIQIMNNSIYSAAFAWSHMGVLCANYSGKPSNNLTISGNKINWTSGNPHDQYGGSTTRIMDAGSSLTSPTSTIIGSKTNTLRAAINATLLPAKIVNFSVFQ